MNNRDEILFRGELGDEGLTLQRLALDDGSFKRVIVINRVYWRGLAFAF